MFKSEDHAGVPQNLRPYVFHGVDLDYSGTKEPVAECPFCGKPKFYVSRDTGLYQCHYAGCDAKGNISKFIQDLHRLSVEVCPDDWLNKLAENRGISGRFLESWGITCSATTGEALVPGYNIKGKITNLYQWLVDKESGKRVLYSTPTLRHGLFGMQNWKPDCEYVLLAEGPWTGAACYEILARCKGRMVLDNLEDRDSMGLFITPTTREEVSFLEEWNVVGVPGCGSFREVWAELFSGKEVLIVFDNDHPKKKTDKPAGWRGTLRTARILLESGKPPVSVRGVQWGAEGYDGELPNGYDLRDPLCTTNGKLVERLRVCRDTLKDVMNRVVVVAGETIGEDGKKAPKKNLVELSPVHCETYKEARDAWRKGFKWTDDLDVTLTVMLATAASTSFPAVPGMAQVWLRVIGAPGTGKSSLCEALSISHKYTFPLSVQKGFHSGYKDGEGKTGSLIPHMNNKTVIMKDGDTLINAGNTNQSLAELRDIYDGTSRARYRNDTEGQNYTNLRITLIVGGTRSLKRLNRSFLGDRFVDCVIYEKGSNPELESDILKRSAANALKYMRMEHDASTDSSGERIASAMELTAGYLHYLRENIEDLSNEVTFTSERLAECMGLGELVGFMRARPDKELEDEDDEVELATRLTQQFVRLANSLAVVLNKQDVDEEVMRRVRKVACDTSRGITFSITRQLAKYRGGLEPKALGHLINKPTQRINQVCRFMSSVGIVRRSKRQRFGLWILDKNVRRLVELVARVS